MAPYLRSAVDHYVTNGGPTSEQAAIKAVLKRLKDSYGPSSFGPKSLKALRQQMIAEGLSRGVINQNGRSHTTHVSLGGLGGAG